MKKCEKETIVAITRPFNRLDEAVSIVESYGATPFIAPTLELKLTNTESLKALIELADVSWLIFTSPTSIRIILNFILILGELINENANSNY